ncbi:MAG: hypothetical protein ACXW32_16050 [Limisphaerales bacterium]
MSARRMRNVLVPVMFGAYALFRTFVLFTSDKPISTPGLVAVVLLIFGIAVAMYLRALRLEYGVLIIGMFLFEITARLTSLKFLLIGTALCGVLFAALMIWRETNIEVHDE